jgi:hypothetical protein
MGLDATGSCTAFGFRHLPPYQMKRSPIAWRAVNDSCVIQYNVWFFNVTSGTFGFTCSSHEQLNRSALLLNQFAGKCERMFHRQVRLVLGLLWFAAHASGARGKFRSHDHHGDRHHDHVDQSERIRVGIRPFWSALAALKLRVFSIAACCGLIFQKSRQTRSSSPSR